MKISFVVFLLLILSSALNVHGSEKIVFIGDSLTEGYGVDQKFSYPSQLQEKLNKLGKDYKVINGGVSGSTTASGPSRVKWFLKSKPKLVVIALGSNDGLRGIDVKSSYKNLLKTVQLVQEKKVKVLLVEAQVPPNYGKDYQVAFLKIFKDIAAKTNIPLIPFMLKDVAGKKELNIADGIHPNAKGYEIITEHMYKYIKAYL